MQICSHVVAAAEVNGELAMYISAFKKAKGKQLANMTRSAKRGLPAGAGCKGEKPAKKKKHCMQPLEDGNRVPLFPQNEPPYFPQSEPPYATPSAGISPCRPQPFVNLYSPFDYFEKMYDSPQLPTASPLPSLEVSTSGIEMQPPFNLPATLPLAMDAVCGLLVQVLHMTSLCNMKRIASSSTQRLVHQCASEVMRTTMSTCHVFGCVGLNISSMLYQTS